jgi:hypothetical protein
MGDYEVRISNWEPGAKDKEVDRELEIGKS